MKVTPYPAVASSTSGDSCGSPRAETKPEDDFVFTWRNLVAIFDIYEQCMFVAMIAGLAVAAAALVVWPFRGAPGVSIDVLGNVILGGTLCFVFLTPVLICYMQWKHALLSLSGQREVEPTSSTSDLV